MQHRHQHRRGPHGHGHGRQRARRGAVAASILTLLDERPMHGYELIGALEERSGGRWRPSPGAIYPALGKLEHRGFVTSDEVDDKKQYQLTDAGRERLAEFNESADGAPWDRSDAARHGELRRAISELTGPARQIGRFGSPDQIALAIAAVKEATATLYRVLADGPANDQATAD